MSAEVVLVTGLTRLWRGATNIADGLVEHGVGTYFLHQPSMSGGQAPVATRHGSEVAESSLFAHGVQLWRLIRELRPGHVEMYLHARPRFTLVQLLVLVILRVPMVLVCTGGEILYWEKHNHRRRFVVRASYRLAKAVVGKEPYMADYVRQHGIGEPEKMVQVHNAIRVRPLAQMPNDELRAVFINTFKVWRHPELVVEAAARLKDHFPDARYDLVGSTGSKGLEQEVADQVLKLGLEGVVEIHPFDPSPGRFLERATVFLLPAEHVFCNNALLEAMERGVPPVVGDVPGAELMVEHDVDGLRIELTAEALEQALARIFSDGELQQRLGRGARARVERQYDEAVRTRSLMELYRTEVWSNNGGGRRRRP